MNLSELKKVNPENLLPLLNQNFTTLTQVHELLKTLDETETTVFEEICAHCYAATETICYEAHEGSWRECLGCKIMDGSILSQVNAIPQLQVAFIWDQKQWIALPENLGAGAAPKT